LALKKGVWNINTYENTLSTPTNHFPFSRGALVNKKYLHGSVIAKKNNISRVFQKREVIVFEFSDPRQRYKGSS